MLSMLTRGMRDDGDGLWVPAFAGTTSQVWSHYSPSPVLPHPVIPAKAGTHTEHADTRHARKQ
jgi:hypothetical protein